MARCLIVGCGCRGLELATALQAEDHAVRGTTRSPARAGALQACGVEPWIGDPDRIATIARAFDHVGVAVILLGSAVADEDRLRALHDTRLDMLMERLLDTTVRGVVYEARGSVPEAILANGVRRVRHWCERSLIPHAIVDADPAEHAAWRAQALAAVTDVLS